MDLLIPDQAQSLASRLSALRAALAASECDAILITEIVNVGYLTGFTGSAAYALVSASQATLITDTRYTLRATAECPYFTPVISSTSGGYLETLKTLFDAGPSQRVGFEAGRLTVLQFEKLSNEIKTVEWRATDGMVEKLRGVKDAGEIATIRRAIVVAEDAMTLVKPLLRAGIAERDFALELDFAMRRAGAEAVAFETIVASGPQSAHPHHRPNDRRIEPGDWVTVDWGASLDGYCSDMTRTYFIGPESLLTAEHKRIYHVVLQAQRMAIAAIQPGKNGKEIDAVARDHIAGAGLGSNFGHSLGHALGRVVHDGPGFSTRAGEHILEPGMVITVEPGVYIENWGGLRIEEDIVVTPTGCEILTHLPNELEILG